MAQMTVGVVGLGAFGRLIVKHLSPLCSVYAYDEREGAFDASVAAFAIKASMQTVVGCDVVILAVPTSAMRDVVARIKYQLKPGTIVVDVGSVKTAPSRIMSDELPHYVDIIATHPLFGPQSASHGIDGLKIVVCPIRCNGVKKFVKYVKNVLGLDVIILTPDEHDAQAALTQGLVHLIAKIFLELEPFPVHFTTESFDLLRSAVEMVRYDSEGVFSAIHGENPYAADVRSKFIDAAIRLDAVFTGKEMLVYRGTGCDACEKKARRAAR